MSSQREFDFQAHDVECPDIRPRARNSDPETSHAAADSMIHAAGVQRAAILEFLTTAGVHGATGDEIDQALGWDAATTGRRLGDLVRLKLVHRTDRTRLTSRGRAAGVYVLARLEREGAA